MDEPRKAPRDGTCPLDRAPDQTRPTSRVLTELLPYVLYNHIDIDKVINSAVLIVSALPCALFT